jgi:hypothetical protein
MFFQRFDDLKFRVTQRRAAFQPRTNRVISYRSPETKKRPVAAFGADPNEGFALDWASYRLGKPGIEGAINLAAPKYEHENTHGFVNLNSPRPIEPQEMYQDSSLSSRGSRTSEGTDQKPISGLHEANYDKPITLHNEPKKSFLSSSPKGEPTEGDRAAADLRRSSYDFSV